MGNRMTVAELIEALKAMPQDERVVIDANEGGGLNDCTEVKRLPVRLNTGNIWFFGVHIHCSDGAPDEHAVMVG